MKKEKTLIGKILGCISDALAMLPVILPLAIFVGTLVGAGIVLPHKLIVDKQTQLIAEYEKAYNIEHAASASFNLYVKTDVKESGNIGNDLYYKFSINNGQWVYFDRYSPKKQYPNVYTARVGSDLNIETIITERDSVPDTGSGTINRTIKRDDFGGFTVSHDVTVYESGGNQYNRGAYETYSIEYRFEPILKVNDYAWYQKLYGLNDNGGSGWYSLLSIVIGLAQIGILWFLVVEKGIKEVKRYK